VSLWRRHCWSSVCPGLPPPASSAPGLSQASDGLLLQTARLSCFIQTPPNRIQRTRTTRCFPCGPDRSILGTVPSGITRLGHADNPKVARTVPLPACNDDQLLLTRPSLRAMCRLCHSPSRLQATDTGGGHIDIHVAPDSRPAAPSCNAPTCHSPSRLQATDTGGGHADMPECANRPQVPDTITRCNDSTARTTTPPL
jgi:hypothetical protein